jgi:hypothetical protein
MQPMQQTKPKKKRTVLRYLAFGAAGIWLLLLIYPSGYCLENGCSGPVGGQNIDGFIPAFGFAPIRGPALLWLCTFWSSGSGEVERSVRDPDAKRPKKGGSVGL